MKQLEVKETSEMRKSIEDIKGVVNKYQLTPPQFRYICKQVRIQTGLAIPKGRKKLPDYLNPAEIYRLLEVAKDSPFDAVIVEFLIKTGLRIAEALDLLVSSIDWDNNQLKVIAGKGAKDRYVPIGNDLQTKIRLLIGKRQSGYLFQKKNGRKYTTRAIQKRISKLINKCKFTKHLSTHSLRHTFACICLSKGMRLEDIKILMGHSSIKTTETYAKLELGSIKEQFLMLMDKRLE